MTDTNGAGINLHYDDLAELFVKMGSSLTPAYLHGSLTGVVASGKRMNIDDWLDWALDLVAPTVEVEETHVTILQGLYLKTIAELQDEGMTFTLMVADDDSPIADRLLLLSEWAGSFLGAFGATGVVKDISEMPATLQEILEDLSEIAKVDAEEDIDFEGAEEDYLSIAEHVRLSAITVFLEYNEPPKQTDIDDDIVH
jgi:uncharacterized protein YgfB (UPF0149 family)